MASYLQQVKAANGDNAFAIMAILSRPLRRLGLEKEFMDEATSGDYATLNAVCQAWAERLDNGELEDKR